MLSKRLESITSFIEHTDKIVDVGCDHGYLSIELYEKKLCKSVIATDINENALENAKKNIREKNLPIRTVLTDGLKNVSIKDYDTVVISGMGTSTILHILNNKEKIKDVKKIILQSNNNRVQLREEMNKLGFYLKDENIVYENKKYYITMLFTKSNKKNTKDEIKYGIIKKEHNDYYNYVITSYENIISKLPLKRFKERHLLKKSIKELKKLVTKELK